MSSRKRSYGFTLVELMIVVVVIGILSAVAYPNYVDSVRKSRRNDGQSALMDAAQRLEVFYSRQASYTTSLTAPNPDISSTSTEGYYTISILAATVPCPVIRCYVLNAVPRAFRGQNNDDVQGFRLHSNGTKQHSLDGSSWVNGWDIH